MVSRTDRAPAAVFARGRISAAPLLFLSSTTVCEICTVPRSQFTSCHRKPNASPRRIPSRAKKCQSGERSSGRVFPVSPARVKTGRCIAVCRKARTSAGFHTCGRRALDRRLIHVRAHVAGHDPKPDRLSQRLRQDDVAAMDHARAHAGVLPGRCTATGHGRGSACGPSGIQRRASGAGGSRSRNPCACLWRSRRPCGATSRLAAPRSVSFAGI